MEVTEIVHVRSYESELIDKCKTLAKELGEIDSYEYEEWGIPIKTWGLVLSEPYLRISYNVGAREAISVSSKEGFYLLAYNTDKTQIYRHGDWERRINDIYSVLEMLKQEKRIAERD